MDAKDEEVIMWSDDLICRKCQSNCYIKPGKVEYSICVNCGYKRKAIGPFVVAKFRVTAGGSK